MIITEINGQLLKELLNFGLDNLHKNTKIINDLNVFPIPDGDTGENMFQTFQGGCLAIKDISEDNIGIVATMCADGMVMNARGNSGVILSQLFYGFADAIRDYKTINLRDFTNALKGGVDRGYKAVDNPVEGTILTVARESYEYMSKNLTSDMTLEEYLNEYLNQINISVQATPDKLPILKESGMVDSGGAGLFYIIEGFVKCISGVKIEEIESTENVMPDNIDYNTFDENSIMEFGYCSEVLLRLQTSKVEINKFDLQATKDYLNTIGDSIVAVQTDSLVKIHVHTFTPYKLLEYCQQYGEFLKIKIENMTLQNQSVSIQNKFKPKKIKKNKRKRYGLVTVASGEGIVSMFEELGVDEVIDGGQTNNPSTEDFIEAFNEVNADTIFVFPNNSNIILTAKQAAKMCKNSEIIVINTKNIGEGYVGLTAVDLECEDPKQITEQINQEIMNTTTGLITNSIRTTKLNGMEIHQNDYIAMIGKDIIASTPVKIRTICNLVDEISVDNKSCCMLIYGESIQDNEKSVIKTYINGKYPDLEVYEIDGKQKIFDMYLILN